MPWAAMLQFEEGVTVDSCSTCSVPTDRPEDDEAAVVVDDSFSFDNAGAF